MKLHFYTPRKMEFLFQKSALFKTFWNVDVNNFWIFQNQFDNIFVSIIPRLHKCSRSKIISCIQINSFGIVQEQFDNIFVSILASPHKWSPSKIIFDIQSNFFRIAAFQKKSMKKFANNLCRLVKQNVANNSVSLQSPKNKRKLIFGECNLIRSR